MATRDAAFGDSSQIIQWWLGNTEDIFPGYTHSTIDVALNAGLRFLRIVCRDERRTVFEITCSATIYFEAFTSLGVHDQEATLLHYLATYLTVPGNSVMRVESGQDAKKKSAIILRVLDGDDGEIRLLITK